MFMTASTQPSTTSAETTNDDDNYKYMDVQEMDRHSGNELEKLDSGDENYVCDISMIKIDDVATRATRSPDDSSCDDYEDATTSSEETSALASDRGDYDADDDDCGLARLYLNEIEIDASEEEQTITELVRASGEGGTVIEPGQNNTMRVAFGIILRLVLPLANGVVRGIQGIRDVRFLRVLTSIASSRQALTNLVAFAANTISMNLSAVQVSHRIEPILKLMKIRKSRDGIESLPDTPSNDVSPSTTPTLYSPFIRESKGSLPGFPTPSPVPEQAAPKSCTLNVLAEPPAGVPIRADIVFIHGLHGSLVNTWKQGLWENERRPVVFDRPPKPPVRPPKRPRHSRSTMIRPPHKQKRPRFAHGELFKPSNSDCDTHDESEEFIAKGTSDESSDFSYVCGEPKDIQICDGIEYSFPTFRLRINDNGRLLQAELESILNEDNPNNIKEPTGPAKKSKTPPKPSSDDPNYSKCWPGDWLPLDCPGVRVIAVNYTTDQYLWRPLWKKKEARTNLIQRSREMAKLLIEQRVGYGHPIVWVGHSKGGLFVKQIIVDAWESGQPAMAPFWRSARGAFFYSVPHRGSHLASIKAPLLTRSVELLDIEKNSKYLLDLHRRFVGLYHLGHLKIEVFSFVETALTLMSVLYLRIVGVDSADPGIGDVCGIRLDHREICKPRSRECILYKELVKMINKVC